MQIAINSPKYVPKKRKSEPKKKAVDTVDKKRTKKAKIKGQNSCFNNVDNLHRQVNKTKGLKKRN